MHRVVTSRDAFTSRRAYNTGYTNSPTIQTQPDGTAFDDVHPTQTPAYAWTDLLNAHDGHRHDEEGTFYLTL
jgi:hypothetical protein